MEVREINAYEDDPPKFGERVRIYGRDAVFFETPIVANYICKHCVLNHRRDECDRTNCAGGIYIGPVKLATMRLTGELP
jgi:hypothetical protein